MIRLTDEMQDSICSALADRVPVVLAYVDPDGQPAISFRGAVQPYSDDQLALWARNPEGGLLRGIASNPKIALLYANLAERRSWQFRGRAHVETDEAVRRTVYDHSPEVERHRDPERNGVAVVVDIDSVIQRGEVIMQR